jgi:hypothetical protein
MMRGCGVFRSLLSICFALCLSIQASAALLFPGGNPHPNALPGWSGTVQLLDSASGNQYYGDIEFAVFNAASFAVAFPGQETPNGGVAANEAIYAFQVFNAGTRGDISQFTAGLSDVGPPLFPFHFGDGLDDNESVNLGDQDYIAGTGQDPGLTSVIPGAPNGHSVRFNFVGLNAAARLNAGEWSSVLFYTSPWGPGRDNGSTATGAGQSRIPGPEEGKPVPQGFIPEPGTFVLLSLAALSLVCTRARKVRT